MSLVPRRAVGSATREGGYEVSDDGIKDPKNRRSKPLIKRIDGRNWLSRVRVSGPGDEDAVGLAAAAVFESSSSRPPLPVLGAR